MSSRALVLSSDRLATLGSEELHDNKLLGISSPSYKNGVGVGEKLWGGGDLKDRREIKEPKNNQKKNGRGTALE
jgi:hypothetical protein